MDDYTIPMETTATTTGRCSSPNRYGIDRNQRIAAQVEPARQRAARHLAPSSATKVDMLHWGFALEFSTLYLTSHFTPGKLPKQEPLNQLVPLIEFSFDSPRGEKTRATMNPGLSYVAEKTWQLAAEAIIPLNTEGGGRIGARAQLLLFLDDPTPPMATRSAVGTSRRFAAQRQCVAIGA
jgi:hypothetical protein